MQKLHDVLQQKKQQNHIRKLNKRFSPSQSWTEHHKELRDIILPISYLLNTASALGALYAIYFAFQFLANSIFLALLICGLLLFAIERLKRTVYRSYFDNLVMENQANGWLIGMLLLVGISLGSTAFGTYQGTFDFAPKANIVEQDSTLSYLQTETNAINDDIEASKKTTWQGKITRKSQAAIKEYSKSQQHLYNAIASRMGMIDDTNNDIKNSHKQDVQNAAIIVLIIAICIELALLICMFFLSKYDAYLFYELSHSPTPKNKKRGKKKQPIYKTHSMIKNSAPTIVPSLTNGSQNRVQITDFSTPNNHLIDNKNNKDAVLNIDSKTIRKNGISLSNENRLEGNENRTVVETLVVKNANLRNCQHCNLEYIYNHKKQKFCSTKCRMKAWKKK